MSYFYFELTDRTQDEVLDDLEMIYRTAAKEGVSVYEFGAPWEGRYYLTGVGGTSFVLASSTAAERSLQSQQMLSQRRKDKLLVDIADPVHQLVDRGLGLFNFSQRFEESKSDLHTTDYRELVWAFCRNRTEYYRKIKNALKPFRLDDGGFDSITSMLEHTGALDPNNSKTEHQLTERALDRVLYDIISQRSNKPHWDCPARGQGGDALRNGCYQVPTVPTYDLAEATRSGYAYFMFSGATYAAIGPKVE
ncbi:hypothetical protein GQ600_14664 [Phytophthora cactorum]|nr:hypothetical protein GQ600_14664 [Phytophthora cactorum]